MTMTSAPSSDPRALVAHAGFGDVPIEFSTSGPVSEGVRQGVTELFDRLLGSVDEPVRHIRLRMDQAADRKDRTTTIRAVVEVRGGAVRSHVTGDTVHDALMALDAKLSAQLRARLDRKRSLLERANANDGAWKHGMPRAERPSYFPRPVEDRDVVRQKSVAPGLTSVDEAIYDLTMMDYDFYLFTAVQTGRDALVYRTDDTMHVMCVGSPTEDFVAPEGVQVDPQQVPELSQREARERLDAGHEPFVFFVDPEVGRGHVMYRRYDGHYGVLVPLDE